MPKGTSSPPKFNDPALLRAPACIDRAGHDGAQGKFAVSTPADGGLLIEFAHCGTANAQPAIDAAASPMLSWRAGAEMDQTTASRNI